MNIDQMKMRLNPNNRTGRWIVLVIGGLVAVFATLTLVVPVVEVLAIILAVPLGFGLVVFALVYGLGRLFRPLVPRYRRWMRAEPMRPGETRRWVLNWAVGVMVLMTVSGVAGVVLGFAAGDVVEPLFFAVAAFGVSVKDYRRAVAAGRSASFYGRNPWLPIWVIGGRDRHTTTPPDRVELGLDPPTFRRLGVNPLLAVWVIGLVLVAVTGPAASDAANVAAAAGAYSGALWLTGIHELKVRPPLRYLPPPPSPPGEAPIRP